MAYFIGVGLGLFVGILARTVGFERDRAFFPVVLIVVAFYYVLFAAIGGSTSVIVVESLIAILFTALAIFGFRINLWLIVAGLAGHATFDIVHGRFISNPGMPHWWPAFCLSIDFVLAGVAALAYHRRSVTVPAP